MRNIHTTLMVFTLTVTTTGAWAGGPAARMGDATATGGVVTKGSPTVLIGNLPAARMTDTTTSPLVMPGVPPVPCTVGSIVKGSPNVLIDNLPAAHLGSPISLSCGQPDTVVIGAPTVFIN